MALINCPECSKEVSDQAPSCPNCAYPLAEKTSMADADLTTIKKAPKKFKLVTTLSVIFIIIGILWVFADFRMHGTLRLGPIIIFIGLLAYILNKIRIQPMTNFRRALITAVLFFAFIAWFGRYEITGVTGESINGYRLDRWTGQVVALVMFSTIKVK